MQGLTPRRRRGMAGLVVGGLLLLGVTGWGVWKERAPTAEERFAAALEALDARDFMRVSEEIDALRDLPGYEAQVHLLRGGLYLRTGMQVEALEQFARVDPEGPLQVPLLSLTGEALYLQGQLAEAEACFQTLAFERPEHADAHRWLGAIAYDLGKMDAAIAELVKVTKLSPDDYRPYRMLGLIYFDFERYPEAIAAYYEALARVPPEASQHEIVTHLAQALIHQHEYAQALKVIETVETKPDAVLRALQSECHWNLGQHETAWKRLKQAAALDPAQRDVLRLQGRFHFESGDLDEALAALRQVVEQDPHDFEGRFLLANVYRKQGRTEDYQAELARVEKSRELRTRLSELNKQAIGSPNDAQVRLDLADLCAELGKDDLAAMWRKAADAVQRRQRAQPNP